MQTGSSDQMTITLDNFNNELTGALFTDIRALGDSVERYLDMSERKRSDHEN
jgi:hypothetical protein